MRERFIKAYMWMFGETKGKAIEVYGAAKATKQEDYIMEIINGFEGNAKKSFNED